MISTDDNILSYHYHEKPKISLSGVKFRNGGIQLLSHKKINPSILNQLLKIQTDKQSTRIVKVHIHMNECIKAQDGLNTQNARAAINTKLCPREAI
jgi:hypothetical protein